MRPVRMVWMMSLAGSVGCAAADPDSERLPAPLVVDNGQNLNGQNLNGQNLNGQNLNGQNLNGQNLNGQNLNGQNLNGQNLNGQNLNGPNAGTFTVWTSLEGVQLGERALDTVSLTATKFSGTMGPAAFSGVQFESASFQAQRGDGRAVRLRLGRVLPPAAGDDVWRYHVEYRDDDNLWYPLCTNGSASAPAIPLNGTWDHRQGVVGGGSHADDPTRFTFACADGGSLGKCVTIGYKPWKTVGGVLLDRHHQACVRLLRGDFCGDGTPYTTNGTMVNLYDALGIQMDTDSWALEAEWDESGARCLQSPNRAQETVSCYPARYSSTCGDAANFQTGTLLMNEIASPQ